MITIYCLASEDIIWYVGSTQDCRERLRQHKRKKYNECSSKDIPEGVEWKMIPLEEVDEDMRYQAERFYIEWLEPKLNQVIPGRTMIERIEYTKLWHQEHKDKIREYLRLYKQLRGGRAGMRAGWYPC